MLQAMFGGKWTDVLTDGRALAGPVYDIDTKHFFRPLMVQISEPEGHQELFDDVGLLSISLIMGTVTSIVMNPHTQALDATECIDLVNKVDDRLNKCGKRQQEGGFDAEKIVSLVEEKKTSERILYSTIISNISLVIGRVRGDGNSHLIVGLEFFDSGLTRTAYMHRDAERRLRCPEKHQRVLLSEIDF